MLLSIVKGCSHHCHLRNLGAPAWKVLPAQAVAAAFQLSFGCPAGDEYSLITNPEFLSFLSAWLLLGKIKHQPNITELPF